MIKYDFHSHCAPYSTCAGQSLNELILRAKREGIDYLAITNHNTINDLSLFKDECSKEGIKLINGGEFSAMVYDSIPSIPGYVKIHILGLFLENKPEEVNKLYGKYEEKGKETKRARNDYIKDLFNLDFSNKLSKKEVVKLLVENGKFENEKEAKSFFKSKEMLSRFVIPAPTIKEVIDLIHSLGGKAIIAHCYQGEDHFDFTDEQVKDILSFVLSSGIDGIEVFHSTIFKRERVDFLLEFVKKNNLLFTIGSDRHFSDDRYGKNYFSFDASKYNSLTNIDLSKEGK